MTDLAEEIDLDAAAEGVKSLYKAPQPKVLDPKAMDKSLLERMPQPTGWRMLARSQAVPWPRGKPGSSPAACWHCRAFLAVSPATGMISRPGSP